MKIALSNQVNLKAKLFILPLFEDQMSCPSELKKIISNRKTNKDFKGKNGEAMRIIPDSAKLPQQILLLGLGKLKKLDSTKVRIAGAKIAKETRNHEMSELDIWLPKELNDHAREFGEGITLANYNVAKFQTGKNKEKNKKKEIKSMKLHLQKTDKNVLEHIKIGHITALAVNDTRDLVNGPNNFVNSETLSLEAAKIAKSVGAKITVINKRQLEKLGMGALVGVNLGSDSEARLVVMEYKPKSAQKEKPIMLVGKGVTFDSGGYNLKPTQGITNMKEDMAGAAVVLGVFRLLKELNINKHIIAITPLTDNLIGSKAQKVNDIVTTYSGKTVEITNTDAEGRLILADAIAYGIKKYQPKEIIDLATLTGACMVALGDRYAGLFGNTKRLIDDLFKAGEDTDELVWPLPVHPDYRKKMKSKIADLQNSEGSGLAGASKAAAFLEEFVGKTAWAHLDIAGVTFVKDPKPYDYEAATGFGVRLLAKYLSE